MPEKFTFPFYYDPHPLCIIAAQELQDYLLEQRDWPHNFGLDPSRKEIEVGKMFGVLVVQNQEGELGYLSAFSGKLADMGRPMGFIPHVLKLDEEGNFFDRGMVKVNAVSAAIKKIENDKEYQEQKQNLAEAKWQAEHEIEKHREEIRQARKERKVVLKKAKEALSQEEFQRLEAQGVKASLHKKHVLKQLMAKWEVELNKRQAQFDLFEDELIRLKEKRKQLSGSLQQEIFDQYQFLNIKGKLKSLNEIFEVSATNPPPAGAGDCAAPKLLHFAFQHQLKPVAMAEFWWGAAPKSLVRKHAHFYPACTGKCQPILAHMLEGMKVDPNPIIQYNGADKEIEILFEDEDILVINKPSGLLSVPGKNVVDSVATRLKEKYPEATGPLIVHRLDQATSGILLIAKSMVAHKALQGQFLKRSIKKRYIALLEGRIERMEGTIDLPLRVDLDNRPNQMVCYEYGKSAVTNFEVVEYNGKQTRIAFYPITGRTHQLRMHAAHSLGLNCPIVGDTLYGTRANRLQLHAEYIAFRHPASGQLIEIEVAADF